MIIIYGIYYATKYSLLWLITSQLILKRVDSISSYTLLMSFFRCDTSGAINFQINRNGMLLCPQNDP